MAKRDLIPTEVGGAELGPTMRALPNDKMRAFVLALFTTSSYAAAAREAGYGNEDGTSTPETMARIANRLLNDDRVVEAIQEVGRKYTRSQVPAAIRAITETLNNPHNSQRMRAVDIVLSRTDPVVTRQDINVKHETVVDHDAEAVAQLRTLKALNVAREKLIEVFGDFGLERIERLAALQDQRSRQMVDAEFREVTDDEELERLLK